MPSNFMLGLGGFAQGFPQGLQQGTDQAPRQQQIDQQRLALTLKGLEYLEKLPYVPEALQGPYTKSLSGWFEKATGKPIDQNVLSSIRAMAKEEGQTLSDLIPGIKGMVQSGQIKPEQVFAIMGGKFGPDGLLTIAKMLQKAQEQKTLGELFTDRPGAFPVQSVPGGAASQGPQVPSQTPGMTAPARSQGAAIELATVNQDIQGLEQRLNLARGKVSDPAILKPYENRLDDLTKRRRELEGYVEKQYAPTEEAALFSLAAQDAGVQWTPGQPMPSGMADAWWKRRLKLAEEMRIPLGDEGRVFQNTFNRSRKAGQDEGAALNVAKWETAQYAYMKNFQRGAGTTMGSQGVQISPWGTFPFPAPPGAQGMPGATPPPSPTRPIVPGMGEGGAQAPDGRSPAEILAGQTTRGRLAEEPLPDSVQTAVNAYNTILAGTAQMNTFSPEEFKQFVGLLQSPYQRGKLAVKGTLGMTGPEEERFADFRAVMGRMRGTAFGEGGKMLTPFEASVVFQYTPTGSEAGGATEVRAKLRYLEAFTKIARDTRIMLARTGRANIDPEAMDEALKKSMERAGLPMPGTFKIFGTKGTGTEKTIQTPLGGATVRPR